MKPDEKFVQTLQNHSLSVTKPRRIVFEALHGREPVTLHALIERCHGIDRASVYRTIAVFEKLGIIQRIQTGWKYQIELSDDYHTHHHHATCLGCGSTISIAGDERIEALLQALADKEQFVMTRHQLELQGYCQRCAGRSRISTT